MSPYHLLETLAFHDDSGRMTLLSPRADSYRLLLNDWGALELVEIDERHNLLRKLIASGERFDYYFATLWNRTALLFERAALASGGHVHIIDDGAGGFGPIGKDWRRYARRVAYTMLDGTQYCDRPKEKRFDPKRTTFHSVLPALSSAPVKAMQIDTTRLRSLLPRVERHFEHSRPHRGLPVFFDTNDCEAEWYPFEKKIQIFA
jgi:hypothetical protein